MKKLICALLAFLLIFMSGCGEKSVEKSVWPVEVNGVTFKSAVKKAVSLSPSVTETLYILGYGGRLVGISDFCVTPKLTKKLTRCGNSLIVDTNSIIKLAPDVVFSSVTLPKNAVEQLENAGIRIVVVPPAESVEDILESCRLIAMPFEGSDRAELICEQLRLFFDTTLEYIADSIASEIVPEETTAVYMRKAPLILATGDSLENELLERIGFVNPAADFENWNYPSDSTETLSPEYIFADRSVQHKTLLKSEFYANSPAIELENVYKVDSAIFERRSPRLFFELEETMKEAFPDAFDEPKPSFVMEMEPPPVPEKSLWEKIFK